MKYQEERVYNCPMPECNWAVIAELGDTPALIGEIIFRHAGDHRLTGDAAQDYLRLVQLSAS